MSLTQHDAPSSAAPEELPLAPGVMVTVRDEDWMVLRAERSVDGWLVRVRGVSELVRDTEASFYTALDDIEMLDPAQSRVVGDDSPHYRLSRLWIESILRKTPVPLYDSELKVATKMLSRPLAYQRTAVSKALDPENLRPRLLIADAVGLGKTLEIGMILSELVLRGRGERILIVTPRHVLEQMQHEMWTRFALPFVRLDSDGIQKVRQKLPSTRNPFSFYKRAIISIDTLKSAQYKAYLEKVRWDAVVIDESHNVTNQSTQNNALARVLAPTTESLILASATPHNGDPESFAELLRLLDPTVVKPDKTIDPKDLDRLIIRRHRHSEEVAREVGTDWAERAEPQNIRVPASPEENALAQELEETWLYPKNGTAPGSENSLFPWTLAKAYLSSPAALADTVENRLKKSSDEREIEALSRLRDLAAAATPAASAKFQALVKHLTSIGISKNSTERVVIFSERVDTLTWLRAHLPKALKMQDKQFEVLHGGLPEPQQQRVIDEFKRAGADVRVLITGDVASEGVNLHSQCHQLVHFDIPWSLIRIEQRNGRVDRFGQKFPAEITTLLLDPETERFSGDIRVLTRLMEREHEAHTTLGDVASLMGQYSAAKEEDEIRKVLTRKKSLEDVIPETDAVLARAESSPGNVAGFDFGALLASMKAPSAATSSTAPAQLSLYPTEIAYLEDAVRHAFERPERPLAEHGIGWNYDADHGLLKIDPPRDLQQRLSVLPQDYLADRLVTSGMKLATTENRADTSLTQARDGRSTSIWPEAHFLGPLHPVTAWASDKALAGMGRNEIPALRGDVEHPTVLLMGTLMNLRGQVISRVFMTAGFAMPGFPEMSIIPSLPAWLESAGVTASSINPGAVEGTEELHEHVADSVTQAKNYMALTLNAAAEDATARLERWKNRANSWHQGTLDLPSTASLRHLTSRVKEDEELAELLRPSQQLLRPLAVIVPQSTPVASPQEGA